MTIARKRHRCDVCGGPILPGCGYHSETVFPGDPGADTEVPFTWRAHTPCLEIARRWDDPYDWYGYHVAIEHLAELEAAA